MAAFVTSAPMVIVGGVVSSIWSASVNVAVITTVSASRTIESG